jgi:hypothetical protein
MTVRTAIGEGKAQMKMRAMALVFVVLVAGLLAPLGIAASGAPRGAGVESDFWFYDVSCFPQGAAADPLGILAGEAAIPYFNRDDTTGNLFVVLLASPIDDNGKANPRPTGAESHLWFYTVNCLLTDSLSVPMSKNDVEIVVLDKSFVTFPEGAILIAGTTNNIDRVPLQHPIVARGVWLDVLNNRARYIDPAAALVNDTSETTFINVSWSPYDSGQIISFAPPDDGGTFVDSVILTCPIGTTPGTLAYDMELVNVLQVTPPDRIFLRAAVYDLEEVPGVDWTAACHCVGASKTTDAPPSAFTTVIRLKDLSPTYATNATYTEIRGANNVAGTEPRRFLGYWFYVINIPPFNAELFGRLHHGFGPYIFQ